MLNFAHIFAGALLGLGFWHLTNDRRAVPFCIAGSILLDLIDKSTWVINSFCHWRGKNGVPHSYDRYHYFSLYTDFLPIHVKVARCWCGLCPPVPSGIWWDVDTTCKLVLSPSRPIPGATDPRVYQHLLLVWDYQSIWMDIYYRFSHYPFRIVSLYVGNPSHQLFWFPENWSV